MNKYNKQTKPPHKRLQNHVEPQQRLVLYCEGKVTEPEYFQAVKNAYHISRLQVEIVGLGSGPSRIVAEAVKTYRANQRDFRRRKTAYLDQVWAVFDRDEHHEYEACIQQCEQIGLQLAYSNPCFELWLLLHQCEMDRPITRHEAQKMCRQLGLYVDGSQKKPNVSWLVQEERILMAEQRASIQLRKRKQEDARYGCPSTTVGQLTEQLRQNGQT